VSLTLDDFASEGGGTDVKALAFFFTEESVEFRVLPYFRGDNDTFDDRERLEGVAQFVGAFGSLLFCGLLSRRSLVFGLGGVGLFCFIL